MKKFISYQELLNTAAGVGLLVILGFLVVSTGLVLSWDWTAVPMFGAPFAPFQAGMGVALLLCIVGGFVELLKDRK